MNTQYGADDRNRTCTGVPPEPKSGASANSATSAKQTNYMLKYPFCQYKLKSSKMNGKVAECNKQAPDYYL